MCDALDEARDDGEALVARREAAGFCHIFVPEGGQHLLAQLAVHRLVIAAAEDRGRVGHDLQRPEITGVGDEVIVGRAAIRGGLPAETAFSLSDLYCQRADVLTEIPLIQNLTFTMLMDFCGKVREIRRRPRISPVVEKCLEYISVHLHEPIGLEQLSRHCGLCGRSLSLRFREEPGMGATEYIHREKLREAEYLLRHTDYSLSEITSYLNYPSQSYFTQIFKKYRGETPQRYRDARA